MFETGKACMCHFEFGNRRTNAQQKGKEALNKRESNH